MKISLTARICVVIVFLSLVAFWLTVGIGVYTNGGQSLRSRYVTYNGEVVKADSAVELCDRSPQLKLTGAGFKFASWGNYGVKVVVNPAAKASYKANGKANPMDGVDVTEFFKIERNGQTITISEDNYNPNAIIKKLYGDGAEISKIDENVPAYIMTVTDGNKGGKSYSCYLSYSCEPTDIKINPDRIIAG